MKRKLILVVGFVAFTTVFCIFSALAAEEKSNVQIPEKEKNLSFYWGYGFDSQIGISPLLGGRFLYDSYGVDLNMGARFALLEYELEGNLNFLYSPFKSGVYIGIGAKGNFRNIKNKEKEMPLMVITNEEDVEITEIYSFYKEKNSWKLSPQLIIGKQTKNKFYQVEILPFTISETQKKIKENPSVCLRVGHFF